MRRSELAAAMGLPAHPALGCTYGMHPLFFDHLSRSAAARLIGNGMCVYLVPGASLRGARRAADRLWLMFLGRPLIRNVATILVPLLVPLKVRPPMSLTADARSDPYMTLQPLGMLTPSKL